MSRNNNSSPYGARNTRSNNRSGGSPGAGNIGRGGNQRFGPPKPTPPPPASYWDPKVKQEAESPQKPSITQQTPTPQPVKQEPVETKQPPAPTKQPPAPTKSILKNKNQTHPQEESIKPANQNPAPVQSAAPVVTVPDPAVSPSSEPSKDAVNMESNYVQQQVSDTLQKLREESQPNGQNGETATGHPDLKRKSNLPMDTDATSPKKRKKKKANKAPSLFPKNALMQLNEMKAGLEFKLKNQKGPVHQPVFTMTVDVNGVIYEGEGSSKQKAKLACAELALESFIQYPNAYEAHKALGRQCQSGDFTADAMELGAEVLFNNFDPNNPNAAGAQPPTMPAALTAIVASGQGQAQPAAAAMQWKNPVMILNERKSGLKYEFVEETGQSHNKMFTVSVTVDDQKFNGSARNKKLAKSIAAKAALVEIFKMNFPVAPSMQPTSGDGLTQISTDFADKIAELVLTKLNALTVGPNSQHARRKVLAGLVLMKDEEFDTAKVICLATGTKCINGECISEQGLALNDCHAEIVTRRSLLRFLYQQLAQQHDTNDEINDSVIEKNPETGLYRMKPGYRFHLYISTSPCGDARIFSPHEHKHVKDPNGETTTTTGDRHPNRKARGVLRTKIESGEGTIPVRSDVTQTWDGVMQGERLLTMSCSDKICKWNVIGLQGALLSNFMEPIYLSSIILGSLYHSDHLSRAIYGRIGEFNDFPAPYKLNQPVLCSVSHPESRFPGKAPNFSINWCTGDNDIEVINTTTGKDQNNLPSRCCKQVLFSSFAYLFSKLSSSSADGGSGECPKIYSDAKQLVGHYQSTKRDLFATFQKCDLGSWVNKPVEQDQFGLIS